MLVNKVSKLLDQGLVDEGDYIKWVRRWKKLHREIVDRITYMKTDIKAAGMQIRECHEELFMMKGELTDQEEADIDSSQAEALKCISFDQKLLSEHRPLARMMYDARVDRKTRLKAGEYPKLELHMDGHNSRKAG